MKYRVEIGAVIKSGKKAEKLRETPSLVLPLTKLKCRDQGLKQRHDYGKLHSNRLCYITA
jgi:hypothetical protein